MNDALVGPITAEWIGAYALASGDDNPLHRSAAGPAIVHGALLVALTERYLRDALPGVAIQSLRFVFLSPVQAGSMVQFRLGAQRQIAADGVRLIERRVTLGLPGQRPAALADCRYIENTP